MTLAPATATRSVCWPKTVIGLASRNSLMNWLPCGSGCRPWATAFSGSASSGASAACSATPWRHSIRAGRSRRVAKAEGAARAQSRGRQQRSDTVGFRRRGAAIIAPASAGTAR